MIKSTKQNLINSFIETTENILLTKVKYIDYNKESTGFGNLNIPFLHKRKFFTDEKEIRLFYYVKHNDWKYDWNNEKSINGINIQCDLNKLIKEVIISPLAEQWYFELIQKIIKKYGFNFSFKYSTLK